MVTFNIILLFIAKRNKKDSSVKRGRESMLPEEIGDEDESGPWAPMPVEDSDMLLPMTLTGI